MSRHDFLSIFPLNVPTITITLPTSRHVVTSGTVVEVVEGLAAVVGDMEVTPEVEVGVDTAPTVTT